VEGVGEAVRECKSEWWSCSWCCQFVLLLLLFPSGNGIESCAENEEREHTSGISLVSRSMVDDG